MEKEKSASTSKMKKSSSISSTCSTISRNDKVKNRSYKFSILRITFAAAMIIFVSGHMTAANILAKETTTGISTGNRNVVDDSLKTVAAPVGELKAQKVFSST